MSVQDEQIPVIEKIEESKLPEPVEEGEIQILSKDFFDIQLAFAKKSLQLAEQSKIPVNLDYVLSEGTNIRRKLDLYGDAHQEDWQKLLSSVENLPRDEMLHLIYSSYKDSQKKPEESEKHKYYGCFWYDITPGNEIFLHFANREKAGTSPLDDSRLQNRRDELKNMFKDISINHSEVTTVTSKSWTYNLPKFNRMFPEEYTQNAHEVKTGLSRFDYWGQFLERNGNVRQESRDSFLKKLNEAKSMEDLIECFPLHPKVPKCDIKYFYKNLEIE